MSVRRQRRLEAACELLEPRWLLSGLTFATRPYPVGTRPNSIAVGHFTPNGALSIVTANGPDNTISFLGGNGDGTFQAAAALPDSANPSSIAVGDFNNDGQLDIVTTNDNNQISILFGNGDGTFEPAQEFATAPGGSIAVADVNGDGNEDLVSLNGNWGVWQVNVLLGNGNGTFKPAQSFAAGYRAGSVTAADINGDGKPDLLTAGAGSISVLRGNGDGTFKAPTTYYAGPGAGGVVIGDVNRDGKVDLVTGNNNGYRCTVSVFLGNGDGTFQSPQTISVGNNIRGVALADMNHDGNLDIVTSDIGYEDSVNVLLGNGNGTFSAPTDFGIDGQMPASMVVGDFNGDGKPDVAVAGEIDGVVTVMLNSVQGVIAAPTLVAPAAGYSGVVSTPTFSWSAVSGAAEYRLVVSSDPQDLPLDTAATAGGAGVVVDTTTSKTSFQLTTPLTPGGPYYWEVIGYNSKGQPGQWSNISQFTSELAAPVLAGPTDGGTGVSRFPVFTWSAVDNASAYQLAVATSASGLSSSAGSVVFTNVGGTTWTANQALALGTTYYWQVTARNDVGAGMPSDILSFTVSSNLAAPVLGEPAQSTAGLSRTPTFLWSPVRGASTYRLIVATDPSDLPSDPLATSGGPGVVVDVTSPSAQFPLSTPLDGNRAYFWEVIASSDNEKGTWSAIGRFSTIQTNFVAGNTSGPVAGNIISTETGDFNNDGKLDLLVVNQSVTNSPFLFLSPPVTNGSVELLLGNGDGAFSSPRVLATGADGATVGDFNGDGKLDVAVANANGTVTILLGNGDGRFQAAQTMDDGNGGALVTSIAAGHFVGGAGSKLDLVTSSSDGTMALFLGNGDGSFQSARTFSDGKSAASISVADFNEDGHSDLAVMSTDGTVSVLLSEGDGTFGAARVYSFGGNINALAVGDLNGDGHEDIAVSEGTFTAVSVLLGNGDGSFRLPTGATAASPGGVQSGVWFGVDEGTELLVGDFNGDGLSDLILSQRGNIHLYCGDGTGSFEQAQTLSGNGAAWAVADFDGDGRADLAAFYSGQVKVLLNPAPLAAPVLNPAVGNAAAPQQPTFSWSPVAGATAYRLVVSTDPLGLPDDSGSAEEGAGVVLDQTISGTQFTPTGPLNGSFGGSFYIEFDGSAQTLSAFWNSPQGDSTYYWEVMAYSSARSGTWSNVSQVTTAADSTGDEVQDAFPGQDPSFPGGGGLGGQRYSLLIIATNPADLPSGPYSYNFGPSVIIADDIYNNSYGQSYSYFNFSPPAQRYALSNPLNPGTYYWEMENFQGASNYFGPPQYTSIIQSFAIVPLPAAGAIAPVDTAMDQPVQPEFQWSAVDGAAGYRLVVATNPLDLPGGAEDSAGGPSVILDTTTDTSNFTPATPLATSESYYWEVIPTNGTAWSSVSHFTTTDSADLPAPTLTDPAQGETVDSYTPALQWLAVPGATQYRIILATSASDFPATPGAADGPSVVMDATTSQLGGVPAIPLVAGTTYYWQVLATNATQGGTWSATGRFSTAPYVPVYSGYYGGFSGGSVTVIIQNFGGDDPPPLIGLSPLPAGTVTPTPPTPTSPPTPTTPPGTQPPEGEPGGPSPGQSTGADFEISFASQYGEGRSAAVFSGAAIGDEATLLASRFDAFATGRIAVTADLNILGAEDGGRDTMTRLDSLVLLSADSAGAGAADAAAAVEQKAQPAVDPAANNPAAMDAGAIDNKIVGEKPVVITAPDSAKHTGTRTRTLPPSKQDEPAPSKQAQPKDGVDSPDGQSKSTVGRIKLALPFLGAMSACMYAVEMVRPRRKRRRSRR